MIQLTTNYSESLSQLLHRGLVAVDGVEVGPRFSPLRIRLIRKELSAYAFYFHAPRLMSEQRLQAYLEATESPTASFHIALVSALHVQLALRFGWYLPVWDSRGATTRFCRKVQKLKKTYLPDTFNKSGLTDTRSALE